MSTTVKVIDRSNVWLALEQVNLDNAVRQMANTILSDSRMLAPVLTGALRSDGNVKKEGMASYIVKYGDARVPYARRRHFENKKNPQTKYYLWNAGDRVVKQGIQRFKRK
ncbi:MAG: hypothetical protein IIZ78_02695 [Clostridiales bacterium]|nr:hypothetical protein [Clostridiales bacterium]